MSRGLTILIIGLCLLSAGCAKRTLTYEETGGVYRYEDVVPREVRVFQLDAKSAELHFSIPRQGLVFVPDEKGIPTSKVKLRVRSRSAGEATAIRDTLSVELVEVKDDRTDMKTAIRGAVPISLIDTLSYDIQVTIEDVVAGSRTTHRLMVGARRDHKRRNLIIPDSGIPSMDLFLRGEGPFVLKSQALSAYELDVVAYEADFKMPMPPMFTDTPPSFVGKKSTLSPILRDESGVYLVDCPEGKVCVLKDEVNGYQLPLRRVRTGFPGGRDIEDLIQVLRYITTREEYDAMINAEDQRAAFEEFWLRCAGSRERAKLLIAEIYKRVEESDRAFSAHVDGWRTDRGIMYIIYGPPSVVLRERDKEVWYYGNDNSENPLEMVFRRVNNPFSDTDLRLERSLAFKSSWYIALDAWRSGRVVNFNPNTAER